MSGTQPMTDFATRTIVRLSAGLSKVPRLKFAWGMQVDPISVGLRGEWAVLADGLQDVHLYLGFDGRQVLAASAGPAAQVLVNGQPLPGQGWTPVAAPGKIQLGEALLRVENEGPALTLPKPGAIPLNPAFAATDAAPSPAFAATDVVPNTAFAATEARPNPAFAATDEPASSGLDTMFDGGALRDRGRALASPAPAAAAAPVPFMATLQSASAGRNAPPSTPPTALTTPPGAKKGAWSEASGAKKAIFVLMPFALASTLWVILDDAPATQQRAAAAAPRPSAQHAAASVPSVVPVSRRASIAKDPPMPDASATPLTAASPPPSAGAKPAPPALSASTAPPTPSVSAAPTPPSVSAAPTVARSGATPRAAVNAALLGNLTQANELYTQLASENPNDPAFGLAARLTAARAVRRP